MKNRGVSGIYREWRTIDKKKKKRSGLHRNDEENEVDQRWRHVLEVIIRSRGISKWQEKNRDVSCQQQ